MEYWSRGIVWPWAPGGSFASKVPLIPRLGKGMTGLVRAAILPLLPHLPSCWRHEDRSLLMSSPKVSVAALERLFGSQVSS